MNLCRRRPGAEGSGSTRYNLALQIVRRRPVPPTLPQTWAHNRTCGHFLSPRRERKPNLRPFARSRKGGPRRRGTERQCRQSEFCCSPFRLLGTPPSAEGTEGQNDYSKAEQRKRGRL